MVKKSSMHHAEVLDYAICVRGIRAYKLKKKQFLESSGIVTIEEPSGLLITSAIISGKCNMKDVTDIIRRHVGQVKCPLDIIHIDTGKLNEFTGHDVEPGVQKLLQIEYITDDKTSCERQVCCPDVSCKPKKRRHCGDIDDANYICLDHIKSKCEKKKKHKHCDEHCDEHQEHHCDEHQEHHHHQGHHQNPHCDKHQGHHQIRMNKMLLFPLFPIRGAYVYPLHNDHHKCQCVGHCNCNH